ncbi:MAG: S8 family serine peptidase [Ardenticatenaceae bacterium]|nr:S8 family serine peptidase [Ardenticatenaceae bacterium]
MFHVTKSRRIGLLLVLLSLILMLLASVASATGNTPTAVANARAKIHPNLLQDIDAALAGNSAPNGPALAARATANGGELQFVARIVAGADLSAYASQYFIRPFADPYGTTVAAGFASPTALLKMASDTAVISLQRSESLVELPAPTDLDVAANLNANVSPVLNLSGEISPGPSPEGWYGTSGAVHGSQEAWAKGYTGAGVRYMSNDSGADYCHPDLQGTWAYIDDASSPYYGLPQMFDSVSSYYAAFDYYVGTTLIAGGLADFADTSATATGDFTFMPIGAAVAHDYAVSGTSLSGEYHYGSHPDKALAAVADIIGGSFGDGTAVSGERAAVLVVDENEAGVYDTVYVDLNYNFDFSDDTPARLTRDFTSQETACLDYDYDGLNDISGGLVYFIADGETAVPTLDWYWGVPGSAYGNGDLVAFHVQDFTEGGGTHGMGTTSVAVGQGVVVGSVNWGPDGSPIADYQGLVVGPGKDVASTQNGDYYLTPFIEDAYVYAGLGYDGISGTGDDIQIVSNSWGFSGTDNDGFDYESRLIDIINRSYAPNTALLFSTGNGAPGYGTASPPSPASGIGIGASTLFGTIGIFEQIESADQIIGGDVISWSNRGPGARNVVGADVVATGAFGTGDLSLNGVLWGAIATDSFSGTSMAAPVAAGNLALMYQAWYENFGEWPTFEEARTLLMNSAKNTDHDVWSQGAGMVNADIGTDIAGGIRGLYVSPAEWSAGDYRGTEYGAFTHIMQPGDRDRQVFTVTNTGSGPLRVQVSTQTHVQIGSDDLSFTSLDQSLDHGSFTTPDYAFRVDPLIPEGTDLLMVNLSKPYEQFDPNQDLFEPFNNWRVHIQNWTDLDGDGLLWDDANGNGKVDLGEVDTGEHLRFTYGYNSGPNQQARIANPLERMTDGLFVTLRHRDQVPEVPQTDLGLELTYWQLQNWSWAKPTRTSFAIAPGQTRSFTVTLHVPKGTPYGMYEGSVNLNYGDEEVVIPVTVAVAASGTSFEFGQENAPNGRSAAILDFPMLYDNDTVFGYTDYTWRAESGDWRFFWTDVNGEDLPANGTSYLVVDNSWAGAGTDIDTIIFGPTEDCLSNGVGCDGLLGGYPGSEFYGPYTLSQVGRSNYAYIGSGRWLQDTTSGGPREIVAAPVQDGLHGIFFHQVRVDGSSIGEPFGGSVGLINLDPGAIVSSAAAGPGSASLTLGSELELGGFSAEGFGLGGPVTTLEDIQQDDPNDPSTASFVTTVDINHGALLEVTTCCTAGSDIDLYVYDPSGALVASSTTSSDAETVSIIFPEDGAYTVAVHGWSVPGGSDTFELTINAVQGTAVSVNNLPSSIPAGGSATIDVMWDTTGFASGTYSGLILMGPAEAPGLLQVPVEITIP